MSGIPVWSFIKNFYAIKQSKTFQAILPFGIDNEKSLHSVNVGNLCYRISIRLMNKNIALKIGIAATFHDIGKLYILATSYLKAKNGQFDSKIVKTLEEVLHESKNLWDEAQGRHYYCMLRGG
ncbi:hypothetical protein [Thermodesulfovibrio sp. TK110]